MSADTHDDFLRLFLSHQDDLYVFAVANGVQPADADDVVQEAASVLWRKFDDFQRGSNFRAWAYKVLHFELRKWADRRRRDACVVRLPDSAIETLVEDAELTESPNIPFEQLQQCMQKLGERSRELLHLHYQDGLGFQDLAAHTGSAEGALRTKLCRIRKSLRDCLSRQGAGQ